MTSSHKVETLKCMLVIALVISDYTPAPGCLCVGVQYPTVGMLLSWKAGAGDGAASASAQTSTVAMWTPGHQHILCNKGT